mgnify:CR=1 FL=1
MIKMLLVKLKKQSGFCIIDIGYLLALVVVTVYGYSTLSESYYSFKAEKFLQFTDIIRLSTSDKDHIIVMYEDITSFQENIIKESKCPTTDCTIFDVKNIPLNSYLDIYYKNGMLTSFTINSKPIYSLFIPDININIFRALFDKDPSKNMEKYRSSYSSSLYPLLSNISVYTKLDKSDEQVNQWWCGLECTHVFEYKI